MNLKKIVAGIAGVILVVGVVMALANREQREANQSQTNTQVQQVQLTATTKTFTSDKLGISFTYEPKPIETYEVTVTEQDNKIYVHGTNEALELAKVIEVFDKDPNISLVDAVRQRFLNNYPSDDCFVEEIPRFEDDPRPENYGFAEISYPAPTTEGSPFSENGDKCPQPYSKTNAVQYFMMNHGVPDKFIFVQLGQDSITTDGVIREEENPYDWSASIRIVK